MLQALRGALVYKKKGPTRLTDNILYERLQNIKIGPFSYFLEEYYIFFEGIFTIFDKRPKIE
jgi:hypothetical protein